VLAVEKEMEHLDLHQPLPKQEFIQAIFPILTTTVALILGWIWRQAQDLTKV
jgi:hypothetical protein